MPHENLVDIVHSMARIQEKFLAIGGDPDRFLAWYEKLGDTAVRKMWDEGEIPQDFRKE